MELLQIAQRFRQNVPHGVYFYVHFSSLFKLHLSGLPFKQQVKVIHKDWIYVLPFIKIYISKRLPQAINYFYFWRDGVWYPRCDGVWYPGNKNVGILNCKTRKCENVKFEKQLFLSVY